MTSRLLICQYCNSNNSEEDKLCNFCGAPLIGQSEKSERSGPIYYNGYILYMIHNLSWDNVEAVFYLGDRLIDRVIISRSILDIFIAPGEDYVQLFYDLFCVAQCKREDVVVTSQMPIFDKKYPCRFRVTYIQSEDERRYSSMTWQDFIKAYYTTVEMEGKG